MCHRENLDILLTISQGHVLKSQAIGKADFGILG